MTNTEALIATSFRPMKSQRKPPASDPIMAPNKRDPVTIPSKKLFRPNSSLMYVDAIAMIAGRGM